VNVSSGDGGPKPEEVPFRDFRVFNIFCVVFMPILVELQTDAHVVAQSRTDGRGQVK